MVLLGLGLSKNDVLRTIEENPGISQSYLSDRLAAKYTSLFSHGVSPERIVARYCDELFLRGLISRITANNEVCYRKVNKDGETR